MSEKKKNKRSLLLYKITFREISTLPLEAHPIVSFDTLYYKTGFKKSNEGTLINNSVITETHIRVITYNQIKIVIFILSVEQLIRINK